MHLNCSAGDEEPLVDGWVDRGWWVALVGWDVWWLNAELVVELSVGQSDLGGWILSINQPLPCLVCLPDNLSGVFLVLALTGERKLVLWLSIWDLVDAEPLVCGPEEAWEVALDVLNVVELGGKRVLLVDDNDLPVSLLLVEESHDTEDLDALELAGGSDELSDLTDVDWVVVSLGLGLGVDVLGVFPGLGEGTVVPEISLVGEAVTDVTELSLLDVLLDGVECLLLRDLHLCVGPPWNLNNHVEDGLGLICVEGDIVEWGDWDTILLDEDTVIEGVGLANFSHRVCHFVCTAGEVASNQG